MPIGCRVSVFEALPHRVHSLRGKTVDGWRWGAAGRVFGLTTTLTCDALPRQIGFVKGPQSTSRYPRSRSPTFF